MAKYNIISFGRNDFLVARISVNGGGLPLAFDDGLACLCDGRELFAGDSFKGEKTLTFIRKNVVLSVPFGWKNGVHADGAKFAVNMPAVFVKTLPFAEYGFREAGADYVLPHYDVAHGKRGAGDYIRENFIKFVQPCDGGIRIKADCERIAEEFLHAHGLALLSGV